MIQEQVLSCHSAVTLPFCIWMLKGFVENIPKEIDSAAMTMVYQVSSLSLGDPTTNAAGDSGYRSLCIPGKLELLIPFVLTYSTKSVPLTVGIAAG